MVLKPPTESGRTLTNILIALFDLKVHASGWAQYHAWFKQHQNVSQRQAAAGSPLSLQQDWSDGFVPRKYKEVSFRKLEHRAESQLPHHTHCLLLMGLFQTTGQILCPFWASGCKPRVDVLSLVPIGCSVISLRELCTAWLSESSPLFHGWEQGDGQNPSVWCDRPSCWTPP